MMIKFLSLLKKNWKSGCTVGLVSIPLAVSLAVASHATPQVGIVTAMWAGIFSSLFCGSNYNIIGPTGALAGFLVMYGHMYGAECLPVLAIISGIFIFVAYALNLSRYLIFVPGSALHGLILGIALLILLGQINPGLGLSGLPEHDSFLQNVYESLCHLNQIHLPSFVLFILVFIGLFIFSRFKVRLPGPVFFACVGIGVGYCVTKGYLPWPVQTLGSKFSGISFTFFQFPSLHFRMSYVLPALSIATISILETMISARIADGMTRTRHNKHKEMLGLGIANLASGFAGGLPATAALARTSLNIKNGATHRISAMISSIFVAIASFLFLPLFSYLPLPAMAGILAFIAFGMVETEHFTRMFKVDKTSFILSLVIAAVTVYEDATVGILLGCVIAMLVFMERISTGYHEVMVRGKDGSVQKEKQLPSEASTLVYTIKGSFVYINVQSHVARLENISRPYTDVVLNLQDVSFIDLDGGEAFSDIVRSLSEKGKRVFVTGLNPVVEHFLKESRVFEDLKKKRQVLPRVNDALEVIGQGGTAQEPPQQNA